jgi:hypothetical protein
MAKRFDPSVNLSSEAEFELVKECNTAAEEKDKA